LPWGRVCRADLEFVGSPGESCGYALDADGTLAIAVPTGGSYALYWASPTQPQLHRIAVTAASAVVAIANDEIVYVTPVGAKGAQLALTDLNGSARPISFQIEGGAGGVSGLAFDGTNVAWADDCIYAGSVPTSAPTGPPAPACEIVDIDSHGSEKVAGNGRVRIHLSCQYSPCTGSLTLTTAISRRTGRGKHKKIKWTTLTVGTAKFRGLAVGDNDSGSLKLNANGLRLPRRSRRPLRATLTATAPSSSTSEKSSATVSLKASRPRKR